MSRYLTPPKVALLVLVNIYCDCQVPSSATLPILSFITSHLIPPSPSFSNSCSTRNESVDITVAVFEAVTALHASEMPGRTLSDLFIKKLWSIDSCHALHVFFDSLRSLVARTKEETEKDAEDGVEHVESPIVLSRTSPIGAFVRRAQLEFTRLQFHDSLALWLSFVKFKEPTAAAWRKKNPNSPNSSFDANLDELGLRPGDTLFDAAYGRLYEPASKAEMFSMDDMERLLEFQADRLQRLGDRISPDMKERLREMVGPSSSVPSVLHFVRFFDAWRAGDYTSAFDNLHRYFDYTMQSRDRTYYQYALLHMAILQADFGCLNEAIAAINETIATARENQDIACLNFSLSWLNHLNQAFPKDLADAGSKGLHGSERDALNFLKTKAKETKMFALLSSSLINEARIDLSHVERSVPKAFQLIYQASHINIKENVTAGFGTQMMMQSSVLGRLGINHLATVYCDLLLKCYGANAPFEEVLRAACRLAYMAAQAGRYDQGHDQLDTIDPNIKRVLRYNQYMTAYSGLLKAKRAIRRSDMIASSHLLKQLNVGIPSDPELRYHYSILSISQKIRNRSYLDASDELEKLATELKDSHADIYMRVHLLSTKALLWAKAGRPQKAFSIALRAANTASRFQIAPSLWEAVGAIATVLVHLKEFDAARRLGDSLIPQSLEGGDLELCARLYSTQADAYMGLAGQCVDANSAINKAKWISKAEIYLERAGQFYKHLEDVDGECEMLAKRAVIARVRGDHNLANDWAAKYMAVYESTKSLADGESRETRRFS